MHINFFMKQLFLFDENSKNLMSIKDASIWASKYLNRKINISNITYLIQYGRIHKYDLNGATLINIEELKNYYDSISKEKEWKDALGSDINWHLSFSEYKEKERTKHVHRLHPYKGKFIPQLVEYFLNNKTDEFKKQVYFKQGDIVLDPFCGSGTTLVQANELGIHAIGIDISSFNALISNVKVQKHNLSTLIDEIQSLNKKFNSYQNKNLKVLEFDQELSKKLSEFNNEYFPSPEYKIKINNKTIDEKSYSKEKEKEFLKIYNNLLEKYKIPIYQKNKKSFLDKWFLDPIRNELYFLRNEILSINDLDVKNTLIIILSRTVRSCRATTHADLATLKDIVSTPYYCKKHSKICKPLFSILKWWEHYTKDTLDRLKEFYQLRTNTFQYCITGDSREINIYDEIEKVNYDFYKLLKKQKIKGIFSSPPYVGLIDYHEQHAYAYELFKFPRMDELEIGPMFKGQGKEQKESYVEGISKVLLNSKKFLQNDYDVFLVANDKHNLYPKIAELAGMKIIQEFKRPVLCRVEKDRDTPYSESIFHLKEK